jgi:hypothetical protein
MQIPGFLNKPKGKALCLEPSFNLTGRLKLMASKSYWSHGTVSYMDGALIPENWVLIDAAKSIVYNEGGLKVILMHPGYLDKKAKVKCCL